MLNTVDVNLKTDITSGGAVSLPLMLMSQDINNNNFILRFVSGAEQVSLDNTYTVEVLTKFMKSGASRLTSASIHSGYARWSFDTSYITQDETVYNYVYVRKSGNLVVSADANAFYFQVGLSEIDKDAGRIAEVYDENYEKYLDEFKDNVDFEEIAQAEQARKEAELLRQESYDAKVDAAIVEADVVSKVDSKVTELTPQISNLTAQLAQTPTQLTINSGGKVLFFGHRGASNIAPENTIPAFEQAGRLGWYGNESDIQVTSDGVWIVNHDLTVDAMTDGTGNVKDMTLAQIKALTVDAGANISLYPNLRLPTFEEFLLVCKKYGMMPLAEIKSDTASISDFENLVSIVRKHGLEDRMSFICATNANAITLRNLSAKVIIHQLSTGTQVELDFIKSLGNAVADIQNVNVTSQVVINHHNAGVPVNTWGISNMAGAIAMINLGVDFITSDNYGGF